MVGLEESQDVVTLLGYYRSRIGEFEQEREEWVKRVSMTEVSHAELHRVKWELRVRQEEICELQNALSDANVQLFEEREEAIKLMAENDQLKIQQAEDRRRIEHLLALTEPVSQEVTYFKDCRPYVMTRKLHSSSMNSSMVTTNSSSMSKTGTNKVIRTIYLPNEQTDSLKSRVESLEKQLEQHSKTAKDRIDALEKDRVEREEQYRKDKEVLTKHIEALEKKLDYAEKSTRAATKDYLDLRHASQKKERETMEQCAALQAENKSLRLQLETLSEKLSLETEAIRQSIAQDGERYVQKFRKQAVGAEDKFNKMKQRYESRLKEANEKIDQLTQSVSQLKKKCTTLEQRRQFDFEGFNKDIVEMQKQFRSYEVAQTFLNNENVSVNNNTQKDVEDPFLNNNIHHTHEERMRARADFLRRSIDDLRERMQQLPMFEQLKTKPKPKKKSSKPPKPEWVN